MKTLICVLLLSPIIAHGDERAALQTLIDEPASLFDITMLRLQDFIIWTKPYMAETYRVTSESSVRHIDINAQYDAKAGLITLSALIFDSQSDREQMKAGCDSILGSMRINLLKNLPGLFLHVDGSYPPGLEEMKFDLARLIGLDCAVFRNGTMDLRYRDSLPLTLRDSR